MMMFGLDNSFFYSLIIAVTFLTCVFSALPSEGLGDAGAL